MIIRQETPRDFARIQDLAKTAFQTARYAEGDEQDFVERQCHPSGYIPELTLVLEDKSRLIAHIMLTRVDVVTPSGRVPVLLLAVSVVAERRNQGFGAELIEETSRRARSLGHQVVMVVGEPSILALVS